MAEKEDPLLHPALADKPFQAGALFAVAQDEKVQRRYAEQGQEGTQGRRAAFFPAQPAREYDQPGVHREPQAQSGGWCQTRAETPGIHAVWHHGDRLRGKTRGKAVFGGSPGDGDHPIEAMRGEGVVRRPQGVPGQHSPRPAGQAARGDGETRPLALVRVDDLDPLVKGQAGKGKRLVPGPESESGEAVSRQHFVDRAPRAAGHQYVVALPEQAKAERAQMDLAAAPDP